MHAVLLEQFYRCAECDEVAQPRHVDAVAVRIADRGRRRADDDLFGSEPVEDADDAAAQRGAPHDRIVEYHEVVRIRADGAVGDVVYMGHQVVAFVVLRDKRAHFDILDRDLFDAGFVMKDFMQPLFGQRVASGHDFLHPCFGAMGVESFDESEKGAFGCVRDVGKDRVFDVAVDAFQNLRYQ